MTDDSRSGDRNRPRGDQGGRPSGRRGGPGGRGQRDRGRHGERTGQGDRGRPGERGRQGGRGGRQGGRDRDQNRDHKGGRQGRDDTPHGGPAKRTGGDTGERPTGKTQTGSQADAPPLPPDVTPDQLDPEVREELSTLPYHLAGYIARHLVMVGNLVTEDPELAYRHARYARRKASRIGAVREVSGVAAYRAGKWQEALSELRAARRMTGRNAYLAIMADCERGLGRPERALELAHSPEVADLDVADRVEVRIVAAGARLDLSEPEAALVELRGPELNERRARPWVARLFYSYADALLELGREREAREYFARASAVDREGVTDADERLAELEGLQIVDMADDVVWTDAEEPADLEADAEAAARAAGATEIDTGDTAQGGGERPDTGESDDAEPATNPGRGDSHARGDEGVG